MINKVTVILIFSLFPFFCYAFDKGGNAKDYISSFQNIHINYIGSKSSNLTSTRNFSFTAYGNKFQIDLTLYYPLHHGTIHFLLSQKNEFNYLLRNNYALHQGKVKRIKDSFVLGYFMHSGDFRGYVITDEIYCIEPTQEETSTAIIYRFADAILPGCKISLDGKDGKKIDCSHTKFFKPRNTERRYSHQANEHPASKSKGIIHHDDSSPQKFKDILIEAETEIFYEHISTTAAQNLVHKKSDNTSDHEASDLSYAYGEAQNSDTSYLKSDDLDLNPNVSLNSYVPDKENKKEVEKFVARGTNLESPGNRNLDNETSILDEAHQDIRPEANFLSHEKSPSDVNDMSCNIVIIASVSLLQKFHGHTSDLVKDIYLQTEMLNILYRKLPFTNRSRTYHLNFRIDSLISPGKDLLSDPSSNLTIEDIIAKHGHEKPVCLTIGLDMMLPGFHDFLNRSEMDRIDDACLSTRNTLIIGYGTLDKPAPMALYFAFYLRAITHALGGTGEKEECHNIPISNPMEEIEKYFLSKQIIPSMSQGVFSQCNVQGVENSLPKRSCLRQFNYTTCGNAIREQDEECDCGPGDWCDKVDKCCIPPASIFQDISGGRLDSRGCVFRSNASCSSKDPCCENCQIAKKGKKCVGGSDNCDVGICNGISSECACIQNRSLTHSPCEGLECGVIPCARAGLKPCFCIGKDVCLICCEKLGSCRKATQDLKLAGNILFAFPDKTECGRNKICMNATCIKRSLSLQTMPKIARASAHQPRADSSSVRKSASCSSSYIILFLVLLQTFLSLV